MKRLIGFTGKARVGKDTAAETLVQTQGAIRYGFADPIYDMLKCIGVDGRAISAADRKEEIIEWLGASFRKCAQTLGTEWGRGLINQDLWVLVGMRNIQTHLVKGRFVVLSDVRFDNEAETIRNMGGMVVEIVKPDSTEVRAHASEEGVSRHLIDMTIDNSGSLERFRSVVADLPYF